MEGQSLGAWRHVCRYVKHMRDCVTVAASDTPRGKPYDSTTNNAKVLKRNTPQFGEGVAISTQLLACGDGQFLQRRPDTRRRDSYLFKTTFHSLLAPARLTQNHFSMSEKHALYREILAYERGAYS